MLFWRKAYNIF